MYLRERENNRSLCICYLKVIEGQESLSTLFGTLRVYINGSFLDILMVLKYPRFKSCERIYTIDFSLGLHFVRFSFPFSSQHLKVLRVSSIRVW